MPGIYSQFSAIGQVLPLLCSLYQFGCSSYQLRTFARFFCESQRTRRFNSTIYQISRHNWSNSCFRHMIRPICPTRWLCRNENIRRLLGQYPLISQVLEKMSSLNSSDPAYKAVILKKVLFTSSNGS